MCYWALFCREICGGVGWQQPGVHQGGALHVSAHQRHHTGATLAIWIRVSPYILTPNNTIYLLAYLCHLLCIMYVYLRISCLYSNVIKLAKRCTDSRGLYFI